MLRLQKKKKKKICRSIDLSPWALHSEEEFGAGVASVWAEKPPVQFYVGAFPPPAWAGVPGLSFHKSFSREEGMPLQRGCSEASLRKAGICLLHARLARCQPPASGSIRRARTGLYSRLPGYRDCLGKNPHDYSHPSLTPPSRGSHKIEGSQRHHEFHEGYYICQTN